MTWATRASSTRRSEDALHGDGRRRRFRRLRLLPGIVLGIVAAGCGTGVYEERVDRTRKLFEYHNSLNQNLQGVWSRNDLGMSMRIPKGYTQLPAPLIPKTLEDGTVEVVEDSRQPSFLGVELPGLVDAWRLPDVGSMYVCSNHQRLAELTGESAAGGDPNAFLGELETALQEGLKFTLAASAANSPADVNARFRMTVPPTNEFAVPKEFNSIAISAGEIENIDPLAGQVYEFENGPIQVAVVLIYLKSARVNPDRGLRLALETFAVSAEPPRGRAAAGAGAAGATGGGKGPSF
jgi:hypothetical protein